MSIEESTDSKTLLVESNQKKTIHLISSIGGILESIVVWCAIVFFMVVGVISLIFTTVMPEYNYKVHFVISNWWIVLILSIIAIAVIGFLNHTKKLNTIKSSRLSIILIGYTICFGCLWIAFANVWPEWDPLYVLEAAKAISTGNNVNLQCPGDEIAWVFCPGGYLERFPYQIPLVLFDKFLYYIFGSGTYLAFEFINIICVALSFYLLGLLAKEFYNEERFVNATLLLCFAFLPLIFYVTFAYGNTLSLPFAIMALLLQRIYFTKGGISYAVAACLSLLICLLLKSSMIYVLAAMLCIWLFAALRRKKIRDLICAVFVILVYPSLGWIVGVSAESIGLNPDVGAPKTVWIAMGLQKSDVPDSNNYGWYNGYPLKDPPENYDVNKVEIDAKESISRSVSEFSDDPSYAITFFSHKFVSEWTDPLYESLLASNWSSSGNNRPIMAQRQLSPIQHSAYYGKINKLILSIADALQFLLLIGTAFCLKFNNRRVGIEMLGPAIIPLGMAILYLFWEAQSQYIMPAYIMMIPYAGNGITLLSEEVFLFARKHGK